MRTKILRSIRTSMLTMCVFTPLMVHADEAKEWGIDVPNGKDHQMIKRFNGSWLTGYSMKEWDAMTLPVFSKANSDQKFKDTIRIEGKITKLVYLTPRGKVPLEVFRNYEAALKSAGFKSRFSCEEACGNWFSAWRDTSKPNADIQWANASIYTPTGSRYSMSSALSKDKGYMLYGTLTSAGQELHVLVYTSVAAYDSTGIASTYLQIVEPKAMPSDQVSVDARALQLGLQADGKVALSGLFFDTGKAVIKDESKPQLYEMAKLMQALPNQKFFIVGHTDNAGNFDSNMNLSLQRAQAVIAALTAAPYRINANRLIAKGNANLAPVSSNADEAGRARNRRVELVEQ